jgi:hypothetical protein
LPSPSIFFDQTPTKLQTFTTLLKLFWSKSMTINIQSVSYVDLVNGSWVNHSPSPVLGNALPFPRKLYNYVHILSIITKLSP